MTSPPAPPPADLAPTASGADGAPVSAGFRSALDAWIERNPLRQWRAQHDPPLTQFEAAPVVGVGASMIGMWEHGVHRPRNGKLDRLRRHLGDDTPERWDAWLAERPEPDAGEWDTLPQPELGIR